jgi:hypothetical protein
MRPSKENRAVFDRKIRRRRPIIPLLLATAAMIILIAAFAFLRYAAPEEELGWNAGPLPSLQEKTEEMLHARKLSFRLTEAEVDALLKQRLKSKAVVSEYAKVTGARFELSGNTLLAHTTLRIADAADVAIVHQFHLEWQPPDLVVTPVSSSIKDIELPKEWLHFDVMRISLALNERLPIAVKNVVFEDSSIVIQMQLRAPSLF